MTGTVTRLFLLLVFFYPYVLSICVCVYICILEPSTCTNIIEENNLDNCLCYLEIESVNKTVQSNTICRTNLRLAKLMHCKINAEFFLRKKKKKKEKKKKENCVSNCELNKVYLYSLNFQKTSFLLIMHVSKII